MRESECENVLLLMCRVAPDKPPLFVNKYTCESENCKSLSKLKIFIKKCEITNSEDSFSKEEKMFPSFLKLVMPGGASKLSPRKELRNSLVCLS